ncbi:hypothetical protein [Mycobacterium sp. Aquia_213]|uniref:hypothetical protein n=1 Tax=Mycobacterium sp. Aquia_213 TaxID=2991728 RepID=UPI0022718211|nr:hypothetical protein [Mycobacterium sp. Aquia_213]WAC90231.1 hypothetical protein LMQ14_20195 [Mycobacterium sp. Aquia_213]
MWRSVVLRGCGHFSTEQRLERLSKVKFNVVLGHLDSRKECLIQQSSFLWSGLHVGVMGIGCVVQGLLEVLFKLVELNRCGVQARIDVG